MGVNYIHIPKNGGRSILEYIKQNKNINMIGTNTEFINQNNNGLINILLVIRDPIKRFVSSFNHIRHAQYLSSPNDSDGSKNQVQRDKHKKYFDFYENPDQLAKDLYSDNHDFAIESFGNINIIKHTQSDWIQTIKIDEVKIVLRLESLNEDFKKYIDPNYNLNKIGGELEKFYKKNNIQKDTKKLSEDSIINLRKYYQKDYELIDKLIKLDLIPNDYKKTLNGYETH